MGEPTLRMMQSRAALIRTRLQNITSRLPNMTFSKLEELDDTLAKLEEQYAARKTVLSASKGTPLLKPIKAKSKPKPGTKKEVPTAKQVFMRILHQHSSVEEGARYDNYKGDLMEAIDMEGVDHAEFLRSIEDELKVKIPDGSAAIRYDRMRSVGDLFQALTEIGVFDKIGAPVL